MKIDTAFKKRASKVDKDKNESGWMSTIEGVTVDNPRKLRGNRINNLYMEESGSNACLIDTYVQGRALVFVGGSFRVGRRCVFGTAGDATPNLLGLKTMLYNPEDYTILPYKHNYTRTGETVFTGYYIPAQTIWFGDKDHLGFDSRGVTNEKVALEYYHKRWDNMSDPKLRIKDMAEYCTCLEDAFTLEGGDVFNTEKLVEQQVNIQQLKVVESPKRIKLTWDYNKDVGGVDRNSMPKAEFTEHGKILITELPMTDEKGVPFTNLYCAGCLTPGEKVMTSVGLKNCEDVTLNDTLYSIQGLPVKIKNLLRYYKEDEFVYKMKLNNIFRTTTFTGEHPIYCATPKKHWPGKKKRQELNLSQSYYTYDFDFKLMKDVKVGDFVKVPNIYKKTKSIPYNKWDESQVRIDRRIGNHLNDKNFWWLIGLLLGDGWAESRGYRVCIVFNINEQFYIDKFLNITKCLIGREPTLAKIKDSVVEYNINCQYLNTFFSKNFGRGAKNKHIPEWVKFLPEELKLNLVLGYLAADGCVCPTSNSLNFVSCSYELLEGILDILFSLGIISTVHWLRSSNKIYNIAGRKEKSCVNPAWTLDIHGAMINKFKKLANTEDLKLSKWKYKEFANHTIPRCFFEDASCEYIYIKIAEIEVSKYTGPVYNYHCETSTFMCKYIPTHNCDAIDTDKNTSTGLTDVSKFCITIMRRQVGLKAPKIVALYIDRPNDIREAWDNALKLCQFYNAKMLVEATKIGVINYFIHDLRQYYLMKRPAVTLTTSKQNKRQYGVPAVTSIIEHQIELILEYVEDFYDLIDYLEVIDQLIRYSFENKRKFDIVASLGMALLANEDMQGKVPKLDNSGDRKLDNIGYYTNEYGQKVFGVIKETTQSTMRYGWFRET